MQLSSKISIRQIPRGKFVILTSIILTFIFGIIYFNLFLINAAISSETGIQSKEEIDMSVFPNPVSENNPLYINLSHGQSLKEFKLFNFTGKLVYEQTLSKEKNIRINLDDESLSPGTYFYAVINDSGKSAQGKLIIN